jgi:PAS domain S-box-containing protein
MLSVIQIEDFGQIIAILIGIGTVTTGLWKYVIRPAYRWCKSVTEVHNKVQKIYAELQPNGGDSLRDQVVRMNAVVTRIETRQLVSEQIDRQVFAALPMGVFWMDERGRCTEVNKNFCRITGRTTEEMTGASWANYLHPDERETVYEEWKLCIAETRTFEQVYRLVRPDGLVQRVRGRACALLSREGKSIGWFGTIEKLGEPETEKR